MAGRKPLLSLEEMQALAAAGAEVESGPSRFGFYLRTLICIAIVTANVLSLSFFPERIFGKFNLPPETLDILSTYVNARLLLAVIAVPLYVLAFVRHRFFMQLSYGLALLMGINLVNDWLLIYAHARPDALASVITMVALRCMVIFFVLLNARDYAKHL